MPSVFDPNAPFPNAAFPGASFSGVASAPLASVSPAEPAQIPTAEPSAPWSTGGSGASAWNRQAGRDRRESAPTRANGSLERAFAACGLIAAAGTSGGAVLVMNGYGWGPLLGVAAFALLACTCLGLWSVERVLHFQRGEMARVYASALQSPRRARFERRNAEITRLDALGLAMAALIESVRLTVFGSGRLHGWAVAMRRTLESRAQTSQTLATALSEDAHAISAAATASRRAEATIIADIGALFSQAGRAAGASTSMADETQALQDAVRRNTAQLREAATLAAGLADTAMSARRGAASLSDVTANLLHAAEQVRSVLLRAELIGTNAAMEASDAGASGRGLAVVAADVKTLAMSGQQALDAMMLAVRGLKFDAAAMTQTMDVISEGVQAQNVLGMALSEAMSHQMEDVARVVAKAGVARSEIVTLHARATEMQQRDLGLGSGPAARRAVERLPAHAEAMAKILRDLPNYEPAKGQ